ncbi:MAG: methylmalonyl-CoA mutase family protein [Bacteroidetes bacterium]|nr:methylmalonyl-CoA mutase family protein [Bacteroidota bacterium]
MKRGGERRPAFATDSGIPIDPVYVDSEISYRDALGFPGEFPFTRGVYPTMYRTRLWTMRQYAGFGTAEESNERYRYLIQSGTTGLSVAFDLPTQIGYDSDHAMAEGEVGKVGVAIDSIEDMRTLFKGIRLQDVSTSMTINATASTLLALYVAVAKEQGADLARISGTVQNDILKEYAARGTYIYPPEPSIRLVTDLMAWCRSELPKWNTISISGYHIREAGSTAVQELAFTLANAVAYVQAAVDRGLAVDDIAPQISFFFNAHNNFFEEVAKFRAARRLWALLMRDRFGAKLAESQRLRFHAQTGGATLAARQIDTNVVRVTVQALAAIVGGCQSLHTNGRDEALALPTADAARLALRTQQVLGYESGVTETPDPLGGSFYVESLTDQIESKAREYMDRIESMGGAARAIEQGYMQSEIAASAYAYQQAIERGDKVIVGVNKFVQEETVRPETLKVDEGARARQIEVLRAIRERRDASAVQRGLAGIRSAAVEQRNLMPPILAAVEAEATVGEISDVLRSVWGEYEGR